MSNDADVMSLDDAIASGDQVAIDAALEAEGYNEFGEKDEAETSENESDAEVNSEEGSDNSDPEKAAATEGDSEEESDGDTSDQSEDDESRKVIKSKDGEHEIPYEVLEQSRQRERKARDHADELQRQLDEANSKVSETQKQLDNAKSKAEEHGIDAEAMFSDPDAITEKELQEIEEDFGKGSAQAKLARNMMKLQQDQASNIEQADTAVTAGEEAAHQEASEAFNSNTDLTNWQQGDPDRWETAVTIDARLQKDPAWQERSVAERFAEVAKRTKLVFGDSVEEPQPEKAGKDRAKEIIDKTDQDVPDSLSDIGQAPASEKSLAERLSDMSDAEREEAMGKLSDAELQELMDA